MLLLALFSFLAFEYPPVIANNLGWFIAGLIVVIGLFIIGIKDVIRFQPRRIWAISSVVHAESIRRRVLWITPLAILGVIVVSQLQRPFDAQDAIRQTTKFCLFATGLVVTITTIILACTNLPREIENRVIYTVVTKPTTRLEIVLGKILGFARVSAVILGIMGVFSWGYLHLRAISLQRDISARLKAGEVEPISRPTLDHYVREGLLNAKTLATPASMNIYARLPQEGNPRRYFNEGSALVRFELPPNSVAAADPAGKEYKGPGMVMSLRVGFEVASGAALTTAPAVSATSRPFTGPSPLVSSTQPVAGSQESGPPQVQVEIFDTNRNTLFVSEINAGKPITLTSSDASQPVQLELASAQVAQLAKQPFFYVALVPASGHVQYWIDDDPARLIVPVTDKPQPLVVMPAGQESVTTAGGGNGPDFSQAKFAFLGRQGSSGQQIKGDAGDQGGVCVYEFRNVEISTTDANSTIPIELRVDIEHGGEAPADADAPTHVALSVRNRKTGRTIEAAELKPEKNRTAYTTVAGSAFEGGNFEVIIRSRSPEQWIALTPASLAIVQSESLFALNLFKSLFILWLLSVLVISISIFSSTFLSWPIAVVLTLVILLGRWGVQQLGDAASAGLGRQFVQDFGVRDPAQAQALSASVEQLNKLLTLVATVLPDINRFSATEHIERGISVPTDKITDSLAVLLGFGLPLSVLAYVFLKNKEVAP